MYFNLSEIVDQHKGLVDYTVRSMKIIELHFDDCVQEGYMGLMQAAIRFNPNQGCEFSSYAVPYIKGYVKKYLTKNRYSIRFPDRHILLQLTIKNLQGQNVSNHEIEKQLMISPEQKMLLDMMNKIHSLDEQLNTDDDNSDTLISTISDSIEDQYEKLLFEMAALDALDETIGKIKNPLHKIIYRDYITEVLFGIDLVNTVTLAAKYGISKQAVAVILKKYNLLYTQKLDLEKCS